MPFDFISRKFEQWLLTVYRKQQANHSYFLDKIYKLAYDVKKIPPIRIVEDDELCVSSTYINPNEKDNYLYTIGTINKTQDEGVIFSHHILELLNVKNNEKINNDVSHIFEHIYFIFFVFLNKTEDKSLYDFHLKEFKSTYSSNEFKYNNYNVIDNENNSLVKVYMECSQDDTEMKPIIFVKTSLSIENKQEPLCIKHITIRHPQRYNNELQLSFYKLNEIYHYFIKTTVPSNQYLNINFDEPGFVLSEKNTYKETSNFSDILLELSHITLDWNYPEWRDLNRIPTIGDKSIYDMINF